MSDRWGRAGWPAAWVTAFNNSSVVQPFEQNMRAEPSVTSVKLVEIRNVGEVPIGAVAPMELCACCTTDGIFDDAATAIATVKPLYEGRHVKQELDSTRAFL